MTKEEIEKIRERARDMLEKAKNREIPENPLLSCVKKANVDVNDPSVQRILRILGGSEKKPIRKKEPWIKITFERR